MKDRKTIFNIIYSGIVDLFQLNVTYLTNCSEHGIRYDWYKDKTHPNSSNFDSFMDEFMLSLKKEYNEESLVNAKESLEQLFCCLADMKRNKGIACEDVHAQGTYKDIEYLLEQAYYAISDGPVADLSYPKVHFESRLLIPSECFFGREELVNSILNQLADNRIYLFGIGGIGKTEIVKSVVNTVLKTPVGFGAILIKDIYWIVCNNSNDNDDVKDGVIKTVKPQANIDENNRNKLYEECIKVINKKQALLVIDNVEFFNEELLAFINRVQNAKLIVVGRPIAGNGGGALLNIEVHKLDMKACMQLFAYYCPYREQEKIDVEKIIELADRHTVSLELLAKLIKKQEKTIAEFLKVLIECGFNFRFEGEDEQNVASTHGLLAKEDRIVKQLAKLFDTVHLNEKERTLLIKFSTVPNLKCATQDACKWFAISDAGLLHSLSNSGWIKREEIGLNKNRWYIHSIIATAVRCAYSDILLQTCRPFIYKLTDVFSKSLEQSKRTNIKLIQFGWSISDIFRDSFDSVSDAKFLYVLGNLYAQIGLLQRAKYIFDLAMKLARQLRN